MKLSRINPGRDGDRQTVRDGRGEGGRADVKGAIKIGW